MKTSLELFGGTKAEPPLSAEKSILFLNGNQGFMTILFETDFLITTSYGTSIKIQRIGWKKNNSDRLCLY